jgi:hypothetical protein
MMWNVVKWYDKWYSMRCWYGIIWYDASFPCTDCYVCVRTWYTILYIVHKWRKCEEANWKGYVPGNVSAWYHKILITDSWSTVGPFPGHRQRTLLVVFSFNGYIAYDYITSSYSYFGTSVTYNTFVYYLWKVETNSDIRHSVDWEMCKTNCTTDSPNGLYYSRQVSCSSTWWSETFIKRYPSIRYSDIFHYKIHALLTNISNNKNYSINTQ